MFCSKCGTALPEYSAFCPKCGNKVANAETPAMTGQAYIAETAVKTASQFSADTDAAFKHKSKLCFFLAFFPLILSGLFCAMTGVMTIFWINIAISVALWVAGWFFVVKRHCLGAMATAGVTAFFSFIGAYLVPIIPICAWNLRGQSLVFA